MSATTATSAKPARRMDIDEIRALIAEGMEAVNRTISEQLRSDVVLINHLGGYIIQNGGKRLRPMTVLLSAGAFDYQGSRHVDLAAIIEFIHTATLLHDDVVDDSSMRRGQATANEVFGNEASVLVGDFLYSRSFEMMVEVDSMRVMAVLARTTNTIAEGEVMQLMNCHEPDISEARYLETIRCKTAKLFEAAAQLGAILSDQPEAIIQSMADYGMHLGTAFQLVDDVLDYSADTQQLGKNIGDDLAEGKPTLPLIHAMARGTAEQREFLGQVIQAGGLDQIEQVMEIIESTGSLAYTSGLAVDQAELAKQALTAVPDSLYKQALSDLADFAIARSY